MQNPMVTAPEVDGKVFRPALRRDLVGETQYAVSLTINDLLFPGVAEVHEMKADRTDGFQRGLLELHAKSMARDLVGAFKADFLRLTSAIQLTTMGSLEYDDERGGIWIDFSLQYPLSGNFPTYIADGQHRKMAFSLAKKEVPEIGKEEIYCLIAEGQPALYQSYDFTIANAASATLEQSHKKALIAGFQSRESINGLPYIPVKMQRLAGGRLNEAMELVDRLDADPNSCFHGRIRHVNQKDGLVDLKSLQSVLTGNFLSSKNPVFNHTPDPARRYEMLRNYLNACDGIVVGGSDRASNQMYKSAGLEFFGRISPDVFNTAANQGGHKAFSQENLAEILFLGLSNMDGDFSGLHLPGAWIRSKGLKRGVPRGVVRITNFAACNAAATAFRESLTDAQRGKRENKGSQSFI